MTNQLKSYNGKIEQLMTMVDLTKNASEYAGTCQTKRDNLIIDLYTQAQLVGDEVAALEELHNDSEVMIIPLPVQHTISNLRAAIDLVDDVLATELARRATEMPLDAIIPAFDEPLDFDNNGAPCQFNDELFDDDGELK